MLIDRGFLIRGVNVDWFGRKRKRAAEEEREAAFEGAAGAETRLQAALFDESLRPYGLSLPCKKCGGSRVSGGGWDVALRSREHRSLGGWSGMCGMWLVA